MSALSQVYSDRPRSGGLRQRRLSACRQTLAVLAVGAVAGFAIFATAAGSLMQGALAAPPAVKSPPPGWIDLAFADLDAASLRSAIQTPQIQATRQQNTQKPDMRKQDPCVDFVYYFLNTNCSLKRVSSARRDRFAHRAVAARTPPAIVSADTPNRSERLSLAATKTTATD